MLGNFFTLSFRNLYTRKAFSFINLFGLSIGISVCLTIVAYVKFEKSYDTFHEQADQLYQVITSLESQDENNMVGYDLGPSLLSEVPEIKNLIRRHPNYGGALVTSSTDGQLLRFVETNMQFVDSTFLESFTFRTIVGNRSTALDKPFSVVITETVANKYFGEGINPLGKIINVSGGWAAGDYEITAVIQDVPENSNISFGFLLSMHNLLTSDFYKDKPRWANFVTYVEMRKDSRLETINQKLPAFVKKYLGSSFEPSRTQTIQFLPIKEIHLSGIDKGWGQEASGDKKNILLLSIIGIFVIAIAWINYINLATATGLERAREVSVKKAIGASRIQLITQFVLESVVTNLLGILVAIGLVKLLLTQLEGIINKEIPFDFGSGVVWIALSSLFVLGSFISGFYPAIVLSSFNPVIILKGGIERMRGGFSVRKVLVVFQFAVSLILIAGTFTIYRQMHFMQNQNLGFVMKGILIVNGPSSLDKQKAFERLTSFKNELLKISSVESVASSDGIPGGGYNWSTHTYRQGASKEEIIQGENVEVIFVDPDFIKTYEIELKEGRVWNTNSAPDLETLLVNEAAIQRFGLSQVQSTLQEKLVFEGNTAMGIIGVIENNHWYYLKSDHRPMVFWPCEVCQQKFSIKITGNVAQSIPEIEKVYASVFPDNSFEYYFLNDFYNKQYASDNRIRTIVTFFAILAVIIACLGLWGLASFTVAQKIREISIRKVLGASLRDIVNLLGKEFLMLILIGGLVALPLIWIFSTTWLDNFAFRITFSLDLFIIPLMGLIIVAMISVGLHIVRGAMSNPAKVLRSE